MMVLTAGAMLVCQLVFGGTWPALVIGVLAALTVMRDDDRDT